jgi:hypothetical protein
MALYTDTVQYSEGNLLYLLPKHLKFYRINSATQFSRYSLNIMCIVHAYKRIFIQCPSHTTNVKIILQATSLALASSHHQASSKSKDTENFTTAVFKMEISFLH